MAAVATLSMSQTKDDLLKHLNMDAETYSLMAKETDIVYKWLTSDQGHLKENCKRRPPYDWSDIKENYKDDAMRRIAQSQNPHTRWYWDLAGPEVPGSDCPNWIARWFLYHKFRYRDGRNRNPTKSSGKQHHSAGHGSSSRHHHKHHTEEYDGYYNQQDEYYPEESMNSAPVSQGYYAGGLSPLSRAAVQTGYTTGYAYPVAQTYPSYGTSQQTEEEEKVYYDPVRDMTR